MKSSQTHTPLPASVAHLLANAPALGVSGSRRPAPVSLAALAAALHVTPVGVPVLVGDADGIDARTSQIRANARVFVAAEHGTGTQALALRSISCVRATVAAGGLWCAFPSAPCPVGLGITTSSNRAFAGYGSGTWSSLALALGLGLRALVYLPPSVPAPWATLSPISHGWWVSSPAPAQQLALF